MHPAQQPTASLLGYLLPEDVSVGDSDKEKCIQGTPFDLELWQGRSLPARADSGLTKMVILDWTTKLASTMR